MSDTLPPANLPPESTPWARALQEMLVAVNAAAVMANTNLSNLERNQIAQDLLLQERIGVNSRDIAGVNTELSRIYIEFKGRLDNHVGRIGTLETKMTTAEGRINSAFEYLTDYGALINNLFDRVGAIESKLNFTQASSIDGLEFLARGASGTLYRVPQSVGSPMGGNLKWPLSLSLVTDEFGPRDSPGGIGSTYHRGIDFGGGGPIKAAGRGVVVEAGPNGGLGNWVLIRHKPGLETGYAHMAPGSPIVSVGQAVAQGQTLGTMGTTGTSTGIHLHLEVHVNGVQTNPRSVINGTETV